MSIIQIVHILHSTITNFFVPKIHSNQTLEEGVCLSSKYNNMLLDMDCYSCLATAEYQTSFLPCAQTPGVYQTYYSALIDKYHCHQILCSQLQGALNSAAQYQTTRFGDFFYVLRKTILPIYTQH